VSSEKHIIAIDVNNNKSAIDFYLFCKKKEEESCQNTIVTIIEKI